MVFTKLLFHHPYTIPVEIPANSWITPKSLAHAIENLYVFCSTEVAVIPFCVILWC